MMIENPLLVEFFKLLCRFFTNQKENTEVQDHLPKIYINLVSKSGKIFPLSEKKLLDRVMMC